MNQTQIKLITDINNSKALPEESKHELIFYTKYLISSMQHNIKSNPYNIIISGEDKALRLELLRVLINIWEILSSSDEKVNIIYANPTDFNIEKELEKEKKNTEAFEKDMCEHNVYYNSYKEEFIPEKYLNYYFYKINKSMTIEERTRRKVEFLLKQNEIKNSILYIEDAQKLLNVTNLVNTIYLNENGHLASEDIKVYDCIKHDTVGQIRNHMSKDYNIILSGDESLNDYQNYEESGSIFRNFSFHFKI